MQCQITGCYRVGSEYVTQIINNAPGISAEMYILNFFRNYFEQYDPIENRKNCISLIFDASCRTKIRWDRNIYPQKVFNQCDKREEISYATIYDELMKDVIPNSTPHWAEKMQLEWRSIPDFIGMFDDAKAVLVVRDPRSILASFKKFTYAPEPRYLGAIFNALDSMQKGRNYRQRFDEDQFHIVKYEDVLQEPELTVGQMLDFLNLSTDHDLLSQEGWTDTAGNVWHANSAFDTGESFDKRAAVHRWQGNLEEWELSLCERVNGDIMQQYGYEPSDVTVPETDYMSVIRKDSQIMDLFSRWKKTGEGVEKYPTNPGRAENWSENN